MYDIQSYDRERRMVGRCEVIHAQLHALRNAINTRSSDKRISLLALEMIDSLTSIDLAPVDAHGGDITLTHGFNEIRGIVQRVLHRHHPP